jgi:hypothetical protein
VANGEIKSVEYLNFLGYCFSKRLISISDVKVKSIKRRVSFIIHKHLFLHPRRVGQVNPDRFGPGFVDWDLVTCVNEVKRYVYGPLSRAQIDALARGRLPTTKMQGLMAYFCLVTDDSQLRAMDGWLLNVLVRACRARQKLAKELGQDVDLPSEPELQTGQWYTYATLQFDMRLPSFYLAWKAASVAWKRRGIKRIDVPDVIYMYGEGI